MPNTPANPRRGMLLTLLAVFALLLLVGVALAAWSTFSADRKAETARNEVPIPRGQQSTPDPPAIGGSTNPAPSSTPSASKPAPTAMTEAEWNAHITEQYPGYRVKQRIEVADQWQKGLGGVNYVLVNARQPEFTLLVSLARVRPRRPP